MDGTITCEAVRALQEDTMNALVRKVLDRVENANHFGYIAPNLEKLISLYKRDTFLPASAYLNLKEKRWEDDKIPDANFEAEANRQIANFNQAGILADSKKALKLMSRDEKWNNFIRTPSSRPKELEDAARALTGHLNAAYAVAMDRAYKNRLFRGVSFRSQQSFLSWVKDNDVAHHSGQIKLDEYFRTSTSLYRAYSFSNNSNGSNYPVIFEVLTNKGIYLNDQLSSAPQEKEVLLNADTTFEIVNFKPNTLVNDNGQVRIAVVQLIEA